MTFIRTRLTLSLCVLLAVSAGFLIIYQFNAPLPVTASPDPAEIDGLFEKLGILKVAPSEVDPNLDLRNLAGERVKLSQFSGKIVFLIFWATWCPPCRKEMPDIEKLHRKLKKKPFAVVAVSLKEPAERVSRFFQDKKLSFTALLDPNGEAGKEFGIAAIPTTFILNKQGQIIGKAMGPRDWDGAASVRLFQTLADT